MPLPVEPHPTLAPFAPAATRSLRVFGADVELVHVPARKARQDRATAERPAFRRSPAGRIVDEEAFWRGRGCALTPNRYPFAAAQRLLWPLDRTRELRLEHWCLVLDWVRAVDGSAMVNNVGAAATIARAHAHLVPERLPFLRQLPERVCGLDLIDLPEGVTLFAKDVPFTLLGVRGDVTGIAEALVRLGEARLTASWNVVAGADGAWVLPRRVETPAPFFPYALGAAELWGRWCYMDEAPFHSATAADLEQALVAAAMPPIATG
ncbi:MAG: hypothetical protein JNK15_01775 [Planctomycetes bacterium]|nr:hypothetical protein [Planctomycetota bacterium]